MAEHSAGILLYRYKEEVLQVFLVHPGGPYWAKKDEGAWSIPKGLVEEAEDLLEAAKREFKEETGIEVNGDFIALGTLIQASRKAVTAFALCGDLDTSQLKSNRFAMEWPPLSGRKADFPEINKGDWFSLEKAAQKILKGQSAFITRLKEILENQKPKIIGDI